MSSPSSKPRSVASSNTRVGSTAGSMDPPALPSPARKTKLGAETKLSAGPATPSRRGASKAPSSLSRASYVRPCRPSRVHLDARASSPARSASTAPDGAGAGGSPSASERGAGTDAEKAPRKRKTAGDRRAELAAHALCGELEPARALCTGCGAWVPLSERTPYSVRPWYAHVRRVHEGRGSKSVCVLARSSSACSADAPRA
jgi:hypothetical protein